MRVGVRGCVAFGVLLRMHACMHAWLQCCLPQLLGGVTELAQLQHGWDPRRSDCVMTQPLLSLTHWPHSPHHHHVQHEHSTTWTGTTTILGYLQPVAASFYAVIAHVTGVASVECRLHH